MSLPILILYQSSPRDLRIGEASNQLLWRKLRILQNKERVQLYRGVVIKIAGHGDKKRFTVRKMSGTIGVERIFPIESPAIDSIEVNKVGKVRRAKLYYLRALTGKKARIKEKRAN